MKDVFLLAVLMVAAVTDAGAQIVHLPISARTGRLTVRVMDASSAGLPGAVIYLRSGSHQPRLDVLSHSASGTGLAEIAGLPVDRYKLIVSLPGFHESRQVVHVFPGDDQSIDVTLQVNPHACIASADHAAAAGRIRDVTERTAPRMVLVSESGYWPSVHPVSNDGTFAWCRPPHEFLEVAVVFEPVGRVVLKSRATPATADTWSRSLDIRGIQDAVRSSLMTRASAPTAVDESTASRRGRVADESGGRLPGVVVSFASLRGGLNDKATVTSDQNGEFDLPRLAAGPHRVAAMLPGLIGGVAYWEAGDPAPLLEMTASIPGDCISMHPTAAPQFTTRHGFPLSGAQLITVAPDGSRTSTLVRDGTASCFAPTTAGEVRVDIEGLGQVVVKPAGVDPATMSWNITIDWTSLVERRLRHRQ